ncbi:acyl-CoA dehydrogenase [soil metagenome]
MSSMSHEDRASLANTVRRVLEDQYAFGARRNANLATASDALPPIWSELVGLGLTSLLVPESFDGIDAGPQELQVVMQEFGGALLVAPWLGTVLCGAAIASAGSPSQQAEYLPGIASGQVVMAFADEDASALDASEPTTTTASASGSGWRLDGRKQCVTHAGCSTDLLVSARTPDGATGLFIVDAGAKGLDAETHRLVDGGWAADLELRGVAAQALGGATSFEQHASARAMLKALWVVAAVAEAVGACESALEMSVRYLRDRKQFGQPLSENQSLRHRIAEMSIELEQLRSAAAIATEAAAQPADAANLRRLAQARWVASRAATFILQQAIQLHGGMGMTEALAVGHFYRRVLVLDALEGGARFALERLDAELAEH